MSARSSYLAQSPPFEGERFRQLLDQLASRADEVDRTGCWPAWQFDLLATEGVLGWVVPTAFGGSGVPPESLIYGYEQLSTACLATTFILTQCNGAMQRIVGADRPELRSELLPQLARGAVRATVGISHLTTSRQHLRLPAVQVLERGDHFILRGLVPWVTGARFSDYVVTGGTLTDDRQVLVALPTNLPGVAIQARAPLLALDASHTASIELHDVELEKRFVLGGPVVGVMQRGEGGGTGSVATSSLAVGLTGRSLELLKREAERRPEVETVIEPFEHELSELRTDLYAAARGENAADRPRLTNESIRGRANSLALRATQALLAASKGAGFVKGHPAERGIREAMFFLVWSCPQPLVAAALRQFACLAE